MTPTDKVNKIIADLPDEGYFSAVGEELTRGEVSDAETFIAGLGLGDVTVEGPVESWARAVEITSHPDWNREAWEAEEAAQKALYAEVADRIGEPTLLRLLTKVTERGAEIFHGPASISMARAGMADPRLSRSAAGAASQALYQHALAVLAGPGHEHFLSARLRLFLGGRWPLNMIGQRFYLF